MPKNKVHPIWWLVGISLGLGVLNHLAKDTAPVAQTAGLADYQAEVNKMIADATYADAHGDMSYQPNYEAAILGLDARCPEKISSVIRLSIEEIRARGEDGTQFALLNELEDTVYMIENSGQQPTDCAALIAQSSYE